MANTKKHSIIKTQENFQWDEDKNQLRGVLNFKILLCSAKQS
jgi:hypothetical protein